MSGAGRFLTGHGRIKGRLTRWLTAGLVLASLAAPAAASDRVVYYHTDIAGSPVATTDAAGEVIWRESYAPYGKRLDGQVGSDNPIWFTGKREERLLDLHYYGARWYDARLGRFLSPDPVGVREADIHSFNRYAYANNNPYKYTDPDGRVPVLALIPPALSLTGKVLSVAGAALTGWTAGSNAYDVYTGEKTLGAAAQDAAIDIAIAATLKGTGAWLNRYADSLGAAGKGLTTPEKYFGGKTKREVKDALGEKYGPPRSSREHAETYYNDRTKRSYNVHEEPGHNDGKPHVDIRRRGGYKERKYDLKEGE